MTFEGQFTLVLRFKATKSATFSVTRVKEGNTDESRDIEEGSCHALSINALAWCFTSKISCGNEARQYRVSSQGRYALLVTRCVCSCHGRSRKNGVVAVSSVSTCRASQPPEGYTPRPRGQTPVLLNLGTVFDPPRKRRNVFSFNQLSVISSMHLVLRAI